MNEQTQQGATQQGAVSGEQKAGQAAEELGAISLRFLAKLQKQFVAELGEDAPMSPLHKTLGQHLFVKVDACLREWEAKRIKDNEIKKAPFVWSNIDMGKLSIDTVHRVNVELDALLKNHIHPVAYWNTAKQLYDIDLRIGYEGRLFVHQKFAIVPPEDIIIRLVHKEEKFTPYFKDRENECDCYSFTPSPDPFSPGEVTGGFGYVTYADSKRNKLVILNLDDFAKSKGYATSKVFWNDHPDIMRRKTIAHRVCDQIKLDPTKVNPISWAAIEASRDDSVLAEFEEEVIQDANQTMLSLEAKAESTIPADDMLQAMKDAQQERLAEKVAVTVPAHEEGPGY